MNVFQRAVVDATDNPENIKKRIKTVPKPDGFEYVMVFWDTNHDAKDGGPETFNTKGGSSVAGILQKEYYINHQKSNVAVWLESPRVAAAGGYTMPLFVKSEFVDEKSGKKVTGGASVTMKCLELGASDFITKPGGSSISINIADVSGQIIEAISSYGGDYAKKKGRHIYEPDFFTHQIKLKESNRILQKKRGEDLSKVPPLSKNDIEMPKMTGVQFLEKRRELKIDIPYVYGRRFYERLFCLVCFS